jgi:hypothetical protein
VCVFATVSALFHLYVMRRGALLTGHVGRSLMDDFCRMPRLSAGFIFAPVALLTMMATRQERSA